MAPAEAKGPVGIRIRSEVAADRAGVHQVNVSAFGRPNEADLVDCLRDTDAWVPGLSFVAEDAAGAVVGHLLLSYATLGTGSGGRILSLAPMAVVPERQREGIGSRLIHAAIDTAETREEPLIVVLGHPWFYPRFGFEPASRSRIEPPIPVEDRFFMVRRLSRWSPGIKGKVEYPACFAGVD